MTSRLGGRGGRPAAAHRGAVRIPSTPLVWRRLQIGEGFINVTAAEARDRRVNESWPRTRLGTSGPDGRHQHDRLGDVHGVLRPASDLRRVARARQKSSNFMIIRTGSQPILFHGFAHSGSKDQHAVFWKGRRVTPPSDVCVLVFGPTAEERPRGPRPSTARKPGAATGGLARGHHDRTDSDSKNASLHPLGAS